MYLVLSLIVLMAGKMLFRSFNKAGVWAAGILMIFFFFGALHDLAKSLWLPSFLISYRFILTALLLGGIVFTVYIKRKAGQFEKLARYLLTLFIILVGIETLFLLFNLVTHKEDRQNYASNSSTVVKTIGVDGNNAPDIFFIVLDEFASSAALEKYFNYRNTYLDSSLASNHFYTAANSKSNYNSTPLSIATTLNSQYIDKRFDSLTVTDKVVLQSWYTLKMNNLPNLLKKAGYTIHNFGECDLKDYPANVDRYFADYEISILHGATLWGRIQKDILWNMKARLPAFIIEQQQKNYLRVRDRFIANNRKNLKLLLHELNTQSSEPKFVFGHIMMPHAPFYFDRQGNLKNVFSSIYQFTNVRNLYLDQLIYTNTWVDSLAKATNQPFTRPRVVIIEGDHGYRDTARTAAREMNFMNLNTWYFSDKNYSMLYDSISSVNTFRVVMNKYFNTRLPLLKDSTILLK